MIPILYASGESEFLTNGLGRLTDIISCTATEERNGIYEVEFEYPLTGRFYEYLSTSGGVIACWHDDNHDVQAFDIYRRTAPISGIVTFYARHISYRLSNVIVAPFSGESCVDTVSKIADNCYPRSPFSFFTNKTAAVSEFVLDRPRSVRSLLTGEAGSLTDVYGKTEYLFDMFGVYMLTNRGHNSGVTIRYGKNLTDINDDYSEDGLYSAIAPFWAGVTASEADAEQQIEEVVYLPEIYVSSPSAPDAQVPVAIDFSDKFETKPTEEELRSAAVAYLESHEPWLPSRTITVNFVQLTKNGQEIPEALRKICLCDTVSVYYPELGIVQENKKAIKVVYDVLAEAYVSIDFGNSSVSLAETILQTVDKKLEDKASVQSTRRAIFNVSTEIFSQVSETYYSKDQTDEIIGEVSTTLTQTARGIALEFKSDLQQQITDNKTDADEEFAQLHSYIIAEDGKLKFRTEGSTVELVLQNNRISMYQDGEEVTYWSNKSQVTPLSLIVPEKGTLNLGNFAFIPRSSGSLDFRKVEG